MTVRVCVAMDLHESSIGPSGVGSSWLKMSRDGNSNQVIENKIQH